MKANQSEIHGIISVLRSYFTFPEPLWRKNETAEQNSVIIFALLFHFKSSADTSPVSREREDAILTGLIDLYKRKFLRFQIDVKVEMPFCTVPLLIFFMVSRRSHSSRTLPN